MLDDFNAKISKINIQYKIGRKANSAQEYKYQWKKEKKEKEKNT